MRYRFEFRPYSRRFKRPLQTSHGTWDVRKGIILRLTGETGKVGLGEIAPLSWFGSETLEQALDFCSKLPDEITAETIFSISAELPACQFGFESAWEAVVSTPPSPPVNGGGYGAIEIAPWVKLECGEAPVIRVSPRSTQTKSAYADLDINGAIEIASTMALSAYADFEINGANSFAPPMINYSGLLPAGEAALSVWPTLWNQGYRTFKWKIGVAPIEQELKLFDLLIQSLPSRAILRLDANGGLSWEEANKWLQVCDRPFSLIEFIEQPLPVDQFEAMLELSDRYSTPLALDESVATLAQMEEVYRNGWRGIFVIKPSIAGSPSRLRQFCQTHDIDAVFSSVFETEIGRQAALRLAAEIQTNSAQNPPLFKGGAGGGSTPQNRALGFGVNHWLEDDETWLEKLWQTH